VSSTSQTRVSYRLLPSATYVLMISSRCFHFNAATIAGKTSLRTLGDLIWSAIAWIPKSPCMKSDLKWPSAFIASSRLVYKVCMYISTMTAQGLSSIRQYSLGRFCSRFASCCLTCSTPFTTTWFSLSRFFAASACKCYAHMPYSTQLYPTSIRCVSFKRRCVAIISWLGLYIFVALRNR
jgi:hypothetical protein